MGKTTGSEETKKKEKAKGLTKKGGADNAVGKELKGKDDTVKEKLTEKDKKDAEKEDAMTLHDLVQDSG